MCSFSLQTLPLYCQWYSVDKVSGDDWRLDETSQTRDKFQNSHKNQQQQQLHSKHKQIQTNYEKQKRNIFFRNCAFSKIAWTTNRIVGWDKEKMLQKRCEFFFPCDLLRKSYTKKNNNNTEKKKKKHRKNCIWFVIFSNLLSILSHLSFEYIDREWYILSVYWWGFEFEMSADDKKEEKTHSSVCMYIKVSFR